MAANAGSDWTRACRQRRRGSQVLRQAMCADNAKKVGVYFGTTGGEVWASRNEGESWKCIAQRLPRNYTATVAS